MEIYTLDACQIADRVRARDLSAKEVLEVFLERIDKHNGPLNAFVHLDQDGARTQAAEVDRRIAAGEDPGSLAGVPIGIKDLENVAGMPTRYGSIPYRDNVAKGDDPHIERLRRAGSVIVGKTATPEFGTMAHTTTPLHGTTRNPWNLERTPGGSSGGSAAAVAAGLLPIATGSDGGGSIRIPAAYSGLIGMKVTYGRIPRVAAPDSSYTSVLGPMARCVRDVARFLDVTMGPDERDQFSLPHPGIRYEQAASSTVGGLRAAWSQDLGFGVCSAEVAAIARKGADALDVRWVDREIALKDPGLPWSLLRNPSTFLSVEPFWPEREQDFTDAVRAGTRMAEERYNLREIAHGVRLRHENNMALADVFEDVDVIVTPTTATTAFMAEGPMPSEIDGKRINPMHAITFTYPFNLSGHPGISIPCGFDSTGLPVGLQVVTRRNDDHVLLALAAAFERARPWPKLAPAYAS